MFYECRKQDLRGYVNEQIISLLDFKKLTKINLVGLFHTKHLLTFEFKFCIFVFLLSSITSNIMTRLHKIHALLKQNYKTTQIPGIACAYNTGSYTPPHLLLKLFQNFLNNIVYELCLHNIYCFIITGSFLPARKQTSVGKIRTCVLYYTNKLIFLLGKNILIYCSHSGQLLTIPARCGDKQ
jgi:hypothetical protein